MTIKEAVERLTGMLPTDSFNVCVEVWRFDHRLEEAPRIEWSIYWSSHYKGNTLEEAFNNFQVAFNNVKSLQKESQSVQQAQDQIGDL